MKRYRLLFPLILLVALCAAARAEDTGGLLTLQEYYNYDKNLPLNTTIVLEEEQPTYTVYSVEFDSVWGRRLPGLYMIPKNAKPPYPALVFGHGFLGSKNSLKENLGQLAANGMAAVATDMWYHGERKVEGKKMYGRDLYSMREGLALSAVDLRRGIDFLESRDEIDRSRITFAGGSMGGILGALAAGMDQRFKAPVLAVGGGDWKYLIENSLVAQVELKVTYSEGKKMARDAGRILAPADPLNTAHLISPRPLLMINAKHDVLVNPYSNKKMFVRAGEPKKIIWLDAGHNLPLDIAFDLINDWYGKYLIGNEMPDFTSSVEGFETDPVDINLSMKIRPPIPGISYAEYMAYDPTAPLLSFRDSTPSDNPNITRFNINYMSTHDRTVHGVLNIPTVGEAPYPCVIYVQPAGADAADAGLVADVLARNGIASVSVDLYSFDSNKYGTFDSIFAAPYRTRNTIVQTVQDLRRLVDFLQKTETIVIQSLTIIGMDTGAVPALITAGLDERIAAAAVFEPKIDLTNMINNKSLENAPPGPALAPVDVLYYMKKIAPRPVLAVAGESSAGAVEAISSAGESSVIKKQAGKPGTASSGYELRALIEFLRDVYSGTLTGEAKSTAETGSPDSGPVDKIAAKYGEITLKKPELLPQKLEWKKSGDKIVLHVRIDKNKANKASVIADIISDRLKTHILLLDNGKGYDNRAGDGIFTGSYDMKSSGGGKISVAIGGLGENGEIIAGETVCIEP